MRSAVLSAFCDLIGLLIFAAGFYAVMLMIPWDEAMAAASTPAEPRGVIAHLAIGSALLSTSLAVGVLLYGIGSRSWCRRGLSRAAHSSLTISLVCLTAFLSLAFFWGP